VNKLVPLPSPNPRALACPSTFFTTKCWEHTFKSLHFHSLKAKAHIGPNLRLGIVSEVLQEKYYDDITLHE
jgi:hypothetical protein